MSDKILGHPDRELIIKKFLNGSSVKQVEKWIKKKYPQRTRLHVSYGTLYKFRRENLNIEGKLLSDIKAKKSQEENASLDAETQAILANSSAYQKKLDEIVDIKLDGNRKILEMITVVNSRIQHYFDTIDRVGPSIRDDKMLLELINTQKSLVQDWKKYVDGVADKTVEHNFNVTVVNEQITVLKNIVFDILSDLEPSLIPVFIEKVNSKLSNVDYGNSEYDNYHQLDVIDAE